MYGLKVTPFMFSVAIHTFREGTPLVRGMKLARNVKLNYFKWDAFILFLIPDTLNHLCVLQSGL
jgi:hypothetical protein